MTRICPQLPVLTSHAYGGNNHPVKPPDDCTRAAELKARQDSIYREKIQMILAVDAVSGP